jgi:hypothetical protein
MGIPLYMVTSGQYSDYHVKGVYSTPEKAEYAKKLFIADNKIMELELDALPKHPEGMWLYCVVMDRHGNSDRSYQDPVYFIEPPEVNQDDPSDNHNQYKIFMNGDDVNLQFRMWATDETHAVKIANEMRTNLLVQNIWPADEKTWNALDEQGFFDTWKI